MDIFVLITCDMSTNEYMIYIMCCCDNYNIHQYSSRDNYILSKQKHINYIL